MFVKMRRYIVLAAVILIMISLAVYLALPHYRLSPYNDIALGTEEITVSTDKQVYDSKSDTCITVVTKNHGEKDFSFDRKIYLEFENHGKWYGVDVEYYYFSDFEYLRSGEQQIEHLYLKGIDPSDINHMRSHACRVVKTIEDSYYVSDVFYIK